MNIDYILSVIEHTINVKNHKRKIEHLNIYFICPVRRRTAEQAKETDYVVEELEKIGHKIYYPPRDTNQVDSSGGIQICAGNISAILDADLVLIYWDSNSIGSHFDLGAAFSEYLRYQKGERKFIGFFAVNNDESDMKAEKSFQKVINELMRKNPSTMGYVLDILKN